MGLSFPSALFCGGLVGFLSNRRPRPDDEKLRRTQGTEKKEKEANNIPPDSEYFPPLKFEHSPGWCLSMPEEEERKGEPSSVAAG